MLHILRKVHQKFSTGATVTNKKHLARRFIASIDNRAVVLTKDLSSDKECWRRDVRNLWHSLLFNGTLYRYP